MGRSLRRSRQLAIKGCFFLVVPFLAAASPPVPAIAEQPAVGCASGWILQQKGSSAGQLAAVSGVSQTSAWAVGSRGAPARTLAERWDGTGWAAVTTPNPNTALDLLSGVAAISAGDAWAVGGQGAMSGTTALTLTEHWNGNRWSAVPSPSPSAAGNELFGVAAVSANNVWAVGGADVTSVNGPADTLGLHWNGAVWSQVTTPDPGTYNSLDAVTAIPGTARLWAVGSQTAGSDITPLIESWTGTRWTVQSSPPVSGGALLGVTALGLADAWAVGYVGTGPLILHWNGTAWSRITAPAAAGILQSVAAQSATRAWAAGGATIAQWNGTSWTTTSWPRPSNAFLKGMAVITTRSGWTAWAVGWWAATAHPLVAERCS
jgi:hypothetical protein